MQTRSAALVAALSLALVTLISTASPAAADDAAENTVTAYGSAPDLGPGSPLGLNTGLIGMTTAPGGGGYWLLAADGGIFTFGNAAFHGSTGGIPLNRPVVGMAATPSGNGYWLVASDGGIFSFGDAAFHGSMGGIPLNKPVVGMAPTPSGNGYWLVASDGGIFSFGDATFYGSTGSISLNSPIVGMAPTVSGRGYWFVAADGGIFAFGDAGFFGSTGGQPLPAPITGVAASPDGLGYWLAGRDGQVYPFGVPDHGSATGDTSIVPTVGIAAQSAGGYWLVHGERQLVSPTDRGPRVVALQQRLTDLGYWLGNVDGAYGELTKQAVYAFQKVNGLAVDGVVGPATQAALDRAGRPSPASTSGDLIEVDKSRQVVFVVRGGQTQWVFNTSTGTEKTYMYEGAQYLADTPTGRFTFTREIDGIREGDLGRLYRPRYFHPDGIAIHGSQSVPPYPASHGCVRLTNAAIDFVWSANLAPLGSPIWVYGRSPGT